MSTNLHGEMPVNQTGKYFRSNMWWWHPLWAYVCSNTSGVLSDEGKEMGLYNDGHLIEFEQALSLADQLDKLIKDGDVKEYETAFNELQRQAPDETCIGCNGKGVRENPEVECRRCNGTGKCRPFYTWQQFGENRVREFAEFCRASGGFRIE